jgi:hypothetical protein
MVIADLLWRPFDVRFQEMLERMAFHQKALEDELKLAGMEDLRSTLRAQADRADDARAEVRRNAKLSEEADKKLSEEMQRNFQVSPEICSIELTIARYFSCLDCTMACVSSIQN